MERFEYGAAETAYLRARDPLLGNVIDSIGMLSRAVHPDPFSALVNSIVAQQISMKAADTVWERLTALLGGAVTPEAVGAAEMQALQACGMSMRKASYIKGAGDAALSGVVDFGALHALPDQEVIRRLTALRGVGVWTAEMLLIFSLRRPDVLSWGDFGIRRGIMRLHGLDTLSKAEFEDFRALYSPYGSVASLYFWEIAYRD